AISISSGAAMSVTGGTTTLNAGSDIAGAGQFTIGGGTVTVNTGATVHADNLQLTSGTINGNGALIIDNAFTWSAGTQSGGGSTTVANTAALTINPSTNVTL